MSGWLIDKSALVRIKESSDEDEWTARSRRGLLHVSTLTVLELGYSARSSAHLESLVYGPPVSLMPRDCLTPQIEDRAVEVQALLANRGQHRAPSIPDLLIAATAERVGLTMLHVDKDYDLIAEVTGQPVEQLRLSEQN